MADKNISIVVVFFDKKKYFIAGIIQHINFKIQAKRHRPNDEADICEIENLNKNAEHMLWGI